MLEIKHTIHYLLSVVVTFFISNQINHKYFYRRTDSTKMRLIVQVSDCLEYHCRCLCYYN